MNYFHIYIIKLLCEDFLKKLVTLIKLSKNIIFYILKIIFPLFLSRYYDKIYLIHFEQKGELP